MNHMTRAFAACLAAITLCAIATSCGDVHAGSSAGSKPAPAGSAAMGSAPAPSCPAQPPARPATDATGTGRSLEPVAADQVLLCDYNGPLNGPHPGALSGHVLITDSRIVGRLRSGLNALGARPAGTVNCPMDTGATLLAIFSDGVHQVQLLDRASGCQTVTNGSLTRWVGGSGVTATMRGLLNRS